MCVCVCVHALIVSYSTCIFTPMISISQDSSQQIEAQVTRTGCRAKTGGEYSVCVCVCVCVCARAHACVRACACVDCVILVYLHHQYHRIVLNISGLRLQGQVAE